MLHFLIIKTWIMKWESKEIITPNKEVCGHKKAYYPLTETALLQQHMLYYVDKTVEQCLFLIGPHDMTYWWSACAVSACWKWKCLPREPHKCSDSISVYSVSGCVGQCSKHTGWQVRRGGVVHRGSTRDPFSVPEWNKTLQEDLITIINFSPVLGSTLLGSKRFLQAIVVWVCTAAFWWMEMWGMFYMTFSGNTTDGPVS